MFKQLKIIHLSDIHCDATHTWEDVFSQVKVFINKQASRENILIVITGDLVDSPSKKNYDSLLASLASIKTSNCLGIICVPGNHDLFRYGNRILSPFMGIFSQAPASLYADFARNLAEQFETGKNSEGNGKETTSYFARIKNWITKPKNNANPDENFTCFFSSIRAKLLQEYGIALYLFNSNGKNNRMFAEGYVNAEQLVENETFLHEIGSGTITQHKKIALLHHHPISIHSGNPGLKSGLHDATLELTNKFAFINLLSDHEIDVVLHGHKHKSTKYSFNPTLVSDGHSFSVSGCGTSSAPGEDRKLEIKVYSFSTFEAIGQSYTAEPRNIFVPDNAPFELISATQSRQRVAKNGYSNVCSYTREDLVATSKTKELLILESGRVSAEIVFSGLSSSKHTQDPILIKEIISADTGRIFSASSVCDSGRVAFQSSEENWRPLTLNRTRGYSPCANEYVELDITEEDSTNADTLRIQYHQRSGFSLDRNDYDELYHHPQGDVAKRTEYCLIYSQIPVSSLELCITFPEGKFPSPNSFMIKVVEGDITRKADEDGSQKISHLKSHLDEEQYLHSNSNCLRVWPLSRTVSLSVPFPQPNLIYAVQWEVPKGERIPVNKQTTKLLEFFTKSKNQLQRQENDNKESFFRALEEGLKNHFGKDVKVFVFAPTEKSQRKVLELIYGSNMKLDDGQRPTMLRGRGIAGTAYIHHRNVYYNREFRLTDNLHVEEIIPDLSPLAVIGLPVTYSLFTNHVHNTDASSKVLFVITVVTESESSDIYTRGLGNFSHELAEPNTEAILDMFQNATNVVSKSIKDSSITLGERSCNRKKNRTSTKSIGTTANHA